MGFKAATAKLFHRVFLSPFFAINLCTASPLFAAPVTEPQNAAAQVKSLMLRVGPPSEIAIMEAQKAGMANVTPHTLTDAERERIAKALASLPKLNREVLMRKLHYLSFLDGIPGAGTALTSPSTTEGLFDITFRASVLDESLSEFLTTKEQRLFKGNDSGLVVKVVGTGTDALTYVVLHESTHIVDITCNITTTAHNLFDEGIWTDERTMVPALAASPAETSPFRGAPKIPIERASAVYGSLAESPFVSLYSTATRREDLAELVAWREVELQHGGDLVIQVMDAKGGVLQEWHPLRFSGVQNRFTAVDRLLASPESCDGLYNASA